MSSARAGPGPRPALTQESAREWEWLLQAKMSLFYQLDPETPRGAALHPGPHGKASPEQGWSLAPEPPPRSVSVCHRP